MQPGNEITIGPEHKLLFCSRAPSLQNANMEIVKAGIVSHVSDIKSRENGREGLNEWGRTQVLTKAKTVKVPGNLLHVSSYRGTNII